MCKILHFFHQYMMSCNYFWMLCEGLYLHTLIVVSVFAEGQRMWWYYLLGWGRYLLLLGFDPLLPLPDCLQSSDSLDQKRVKGSGSVRRDGTQVLATVQSPRELDRFS